jgi:hypothetical protein
MTDSDRTFFRRRMQEELEKARATDKPDLRHLHLRWASIYESRLAGKHISLHDAMNESLHILG